MPFEVDISCSAAAAKVDLLKLRSDLEFGLKSEGVRHAVLSVTIVDNPTMHTLNRHHLQHDYPTDVISFQLEWSCETATTEARSQLSCGRSAAASIEGEIVVSWEYAEEMATHCGWSTQDELTLYAIHGMLHICGYDDLTPTEKEIMRSRERVILTGIGLDPKYPDDCDPDDDEPPSEQDPADPDSRQTSEGLH